MILDMSRFEILLEVDEKYITIFGQDFSFYKTENILEEEIKGLKLDFITDEWSLIKWDDGSYTTPNERQRILQVLKENNIAIYVFKATNERFEKEYKMKTEYEKRFGVPITDFERSIDAVCFTREETGFLQPSSTISVSILSNTVSYYVPDDGFGRGRCLKVNLDMIEWLDFIIALYNKCNISKWEKKCYGNEFERPKWKLEIFFTMEDSLNFFGNNNEYPPYWDELIKIMENIEIKIKNYAADKLREEYIKKFGIPMSNFEFLAERVAFFIEPCHYISIIRTIGNENEFAKFLADELEVNLDVGEWFDFINSLYKCNITEWEKDYSNKNLGGDENWSLIISFSDMRKLEFSGINAYPSNWDKFKNIMDSMEIRMKIKYQLMKNKKMQSVGYKQESRKYENKEKTIVPIDTIFSGSQEEIIKKFNLWRGSKSC